MTSIREDICPVCSGNSALTKSDFPGYQQPSRFKIYHCSSCRVAYALPRVNTSELYEKIYSAGSQVPGYNRYWNYAKEALNHKKPFEYLARNEPAYWGVSQALNRLVPEKSHSVILEVGSGMGYLTYSLIKEGYNVRGIDISKVAVDNACKKFGKYYIQGDIFKYSIESPASADVIILTEVIEHVEDPILFLEALLDILSPGGSIVLTTPNKSPYPQNVIWASDSPPVHYWWFSEESIRKIAEKLELNAEFINFREFYRRKYQSDNIRTLLDESRYNSYFDKEGNLATRNEPRKNLISTYFLKSLKSITFLRNSYFKILDKLTKDKVVFGECGAVLCVVLKRTK